MQLRFRIISFILILVLFPVMVVPVGAQEFTSSNSNVTNLLDTSVFYYDGVSYFSSQFPINSSEVYLCWSTASTAVCKEFVLTISSSSNINSIVFNGLSGSLIGSDGSIKQYKFSSPNSYLGVDSVSLDISFNGGIGSSFSIISFFGLQDNSFSISSVDYSVYRDYLLHDHIVYERDLLSEQFSASVPFSYFHSAGYGVGVSDRTLIEGALSIKIMPSQLKFDYLDQLSIQVFSSGEYYLSAALFDISTGNQISSLNVIEENYHYSEYTYYNNSFQIIYQRDMVTVDLSGYDLSNAYVNIILVAFDVTTDASTEEQSGFYFGVDWIEAFVPFDDLPWYIIFNNFLNGWLGDLKNNLWSIHFDLTSALSSFFSSNFSNLSSWLNSHFQDLLGWISDLKNNLWEIHTDLTSSLSGFFGDLKNNFWQIHTDLTSKLEAWFQFTVASIVNAINPDPDAGEDAKDHGAEIGQEIGNLNDQMNSMVKPDLSGTGDISGIISHGDLTNYTNFLTTLVNAPYISQVIMLSLILSLAGYVLFGKR